MTSYRRGVGYEKRSDFVEATDRCRERWYVPCLKDFASSKDDCRTCVKINQKQTTSVWTYLFVAILIILAIGFFYRLFRSPTVDVQTTADLLFGTPGISDPYTQINTLVSGSPQEYYI